MLDWRGFGGRSEIDCRVRSRRVFVGLWGWCGVGESRFSVIAGRECGSGESSSTVNCWSPLGVDEAIID